MKKKTKTRKKFGRICTLAVIGMFVMMTSMSTSANDPDDWTMGGDSFNGTGTMQILGTLSEDSISIIAGGQQGIIVDGVLNPGFVGIGLAPGMFPVNQMDVAGGMAVGGGFAGASPAPPNGMVIQGWVGIGTADPHYPLEVVGDVWLNSDTIKMGDGTFYIKVQKDAKLSTGNYRIIIDENDDQTDRYFSVEKDEGKNDPQGSGTELMRCQENGNVGIATNAPTEKLDVNGRVRVRDLPIDNALTYVVAADSTGVLHRRDAGTIGIQNLWETINSDSGSTIANIPTDTLNIYGAGIATTSIVGDTLTITAIEVDGDPTNELQNLAEVYAHDGATGNAVQLTAANGDIRFYNDDPTDMLFLDESSGRIGIGTAIPTQKLHVAGSVRIEEHIYDSSNDAGTSGQILSSIVTGINWIDPLNVGIPSGVIIMWSGTLASIPSGWALCDGTSGTPDLREKFIYGWTDSVNPGGTGGSSSHSHTVNPHSHTVNSHSHTVNSHSHTVNAHTHWVNPPATNTGFESATVRGCSYEHPTIPQIAVADNSHYHNVDIPGFSSGSASPGTSSSSPGTSSSSPGTSSESPGTDPQSNLPPYYKLAFIMKL